MGLYSGTRTTYHKSEFIEEFDLIRMRHVEINCWCIIKNFEKYTYEAGPFLEKIWERCLNVKIQNLMSVKILISMQFQYISRIHRYEKGILYL